MNRRGMHTLYHNSKRMSRRPAYAWHACAPCARKRRSACAGGRERKLCSHFIVRLFVLQEGLTSPHLLSSHRQSLWEEAYVVPRPRPTTESLLRRSRYTQFLLPSHPLSPTTLPQYSHNTSTTPITLTTLSSYSHITCVSVLWVHCTAWSIARVLCL